MKLKAPFNLVIVGKMHYGKTTTIKNLLSNFYDDRIFAFNPYHDYDKITDNLFYDKQKFLNTINKKKNSVFVFEEATAFFKNSNDVISRLLTGNHHDNNCNIFVFHSLRAIPIEIYDYIDSLFCFRTNDRPQLILQKYKGVLSEKDLVKIQSLPKYKFIKFDF